MLRNNFSSHFHSTIDFKISREPQNLTGLAALFYRWENRLYDLRSFQNSVPQTKFYSLEDFILYFHFGKIYNICQNIENSEIFHFVVPNVPQSLRSHDERILLLSNIYYYFIEHSLWDSTINNFYLYIILCISFQKFVIVT